MIYLRGKSPNWFKNQFYPSRRLSKLGAQRGMNTKKPTLVLLFGSHKNPANHVDRQAHASDTVLFESREMTGRSQKHCLGGWGRRGKDDREQNALAPLGYTTQSQKNKRKEI
jgi:hypothetical protein